MNRLYYLLLAVLSLIIIFLSKGIFFGENSYNKRAELIEDNKIISVSTFPGKDCFEYENPLFVGHPGTVAKRSANLAIQNCDLLISIGCSLNNIITAYNQAEFARNADKLIFDIDKNELNKVEEKLKNIEPDNTKPIEALEILYELKKLSDKKY